jgi:hypothetical protein
MRFKQWLEFDTNWSFQRLPGEEDNANGRPLDPDVRSKYVASDQETPLPGKKRKSPGWAEKFLGDKTIRAKDPMFGKSLDRRLNRLGLKYDQPPLT